MHVLKGTVRSLYFKRGFDLEGVKSVIICQFPLHPSKGIRETIFGNLENYRFIDNISSILFSNNRILNSLRLSRVKFCSLLSLIMTNKNGNIHLDPKSTTHYCTQITLI